MFCNHKYIGHMLNTVSCSHRDISHMRNTVFCEKTFVLENRHAEHCIKYVTYILKTTTHSNNLIWIQHNLNYNCI